MAAPRRICRVCGGARIPVNGLDRHPNCYGDDEVLWSLPDRVAWSAARTARATTETPSTNAALTTKGSR